MGSIFINKPVFSGIIGTTFALLSCTSVWACRPSVGTPPFPPGVQPQAYIAFDTAFDEQKEGDATCAMRHYELARAGFRREMISSNDVRLQRRAKEHLVAALSQIGVLLAEHDRAAAHKSWTEAAILTQPVPSTANITILGDSLFSRHMYKAAFAAYKNTFFPADHEPVLSPQEIDAGDVMYIKHGLNLALSGNFVDAARILSESPLSQVATYLEAQAYFAAGRRSAAYRSYVEALTIALPSTSDVPSLGPLSYATWMRLIELGNQ